VHTLVQRAEIKICFRRTRWQQPAFESYSTAQQAQKKWAEILLKAERAHCSANSSTHAASSENKNNDAAAAAMHRAQHLIPYLV
jgi:hypothetical protein